VGPRNRVLDGGAHWRNLANNIEPRSTGLLVQNCDGFGEFGELSMCGGDAALCQITLTTFLLKFGTVW